MTVRTHAVARAAYERVIERRDGTAGDKEQRKKYSALAHKLPGMILMNGLAQTTGFLLVKGTSEHRALLDDLCAVLCTAEATNATDAQDFHQEVIAADLDRTLLLTRRSLEASGWLKRYVQGVLRVDATGDSIANDASSGGDR